MWFTLLLLPLYGCGDCSGIKFTATKALQTQELNDNPALSMLAGR